MKYIIFQQKNPERKIAIIFPNDLTHSIMAESLLRSNIEMCNAVPISAGEYNGIDGTCSGKSTTLNLKSNPEEDERLIQGLDYGFGYL